MASAHDSDHDAIFGKDLRVYSSPTPPDFCALCAELNHWVVELAASHPNLSDSAITWINEVADRAASALAQPEPEGVTDEEILASVRHFYGDQTAADMGAEDDLRTARAVLARWRNHS
jgi:hypothetical protein